MKLTSILAAVAAALFSTTAAFAAENPEPGDTAKQLDAVKKSLTGQKYLLQYKFTPGETIRYKVVQLVTVETKMRGQTSTTKMRSASTKAWKVTVVDEKGAATFVHSVEDVDMWNKASGVQEMRYNSKTDKKPPPAYAYVAANVGVPLTTATVDPHGRILKRHENRPKAGQSGQLIVPLAPQEVKIGDKWYFPREVRVKLRSGEVKRIKTRDAYRLAKVETGVATIAVETQILTPVDDAEIKAQLIQRLTRGTIKFDIAAGRVLSQQLDSDETVIGFSGADSMMQYLARFTEQLVPAEAKTARKP